MRNDEKVPMNLQIIKIDETEYHNESFLKHFPEVKRIFGVYITDFNEYTFRVTYLAESTPSFFLKHLENQANISAAMSDERLEELEDALRSTGNQDFYEHVYQIEKAPTFRAGFFPKGKIGKRHWATYSVKDIEEEYDGNRQEAFQDAVEDFFGNPI